MPTASAAASPATRPLGLSPHMDAGSVERWLDDEYQHVFRHVFSGNWRAYDPFDGAGRAETDEIPSPAVCSAFRSFQGWTALTPQGPNDGTLQVMPLDQGDGLPAAASADGRCAGGRALRRRTGPRLLDRAGMASAADPGLCSIPKVEPGDTVWWHTDIVHSVEDEHRGKGYSNVIYIAAAPYCAKNAAYLERQKPTFLAGRSAPDFSAEDYEGRFRRPRHGGGLDRTQDRWGSFRGRAACALLDPVLGPTEVRQRHALVDGR